MGVRRMGSKRYAPVGVCIYCGTTSRKLTDEHIIAYGLNANAILPKASCEDCNKITRKIEESVLRGFAWQMRTALGFQTRRPKEAPKTFRLGVVRGGAEEEIDVPVEDHPILLSLPMYEPPAYLDNRIYKKARDYKEGIGLSGLVTVWFRDREEILRRFNAESIFVVQKMDHIAFAQMLGKIAYCFAVAELGLAAIEEPYILPAIRGERNDIGQWVGSTNFVFPPSPGIDHNTEVTSWMWPNAEPPDGFILALIRLFSHAPSPGYMVVVGRPRPTEGACGLQAIPG